MVTQADDMAALLLQATTCLADAGFGAGATLMERLQALVQDYQRAQTLKAEAHQALAAAHQAVTRHLPEGRPQGDARLTLAERIDALALALRRASYDAGVAEAHLQVDHAQAALAAGYAAHAALKAGYAAVAEAFPGTDTEIAAEVPLAEHLEALADACYRQGYEVGKAWEQGKEAAQESPCACWLALPCAGLQQVAGEAQTAAARARRSTIEVADLRGAVEALQAELRGALAALAYWERR